MKKQFVFFSVAAMLAVFASCKKDSVSPVSTAAATGTKVQRTGAAKILYDPYIDDCVTGVNKTCLNPVVIKSNKLIILDAAIVEGGAGIARLFSDAQTALSYIPEFNDASFSSIRQLIVSGTATMTKKDKGDHILYLINSSVNPQTLPYMVMNYELE